MATFTIVIKSNASQLTDVLIRDLGIFIPSEGGSETFTSHDELQEIINSQDLAAYLIDDAYGVGSSTLILNDGIGNISQADAQNFLTSIDLGDGNDNFGVVKANAEGELDDNLTFNGVATVSGLIAGSNVSLGNFKITNLGPGTGPLDAINKAQLDSATVGGKVWKELIIHCDQLFNGGSGGILQAVPFWLTNQPSINDNFVITDGSTTETFTFLASETNPFDVAIGGTAADTMANLAQAINDDSTLWSASVSDLLDQFNSRIIVIYRTTQSVASYPDRIYGTLATPAFGQYINYNGELDYESSLAVQLPAVDPAVKTFGLGREYVSLVSNETHLCRDMDTAYTWNADQDQWENTGANGVIAGPGLIKTGQILEVDFGEVGDIQPLGSTISAGSLDEAARADHVHTHGNRGGDSAGSQHDADQVDVEGTYARIGAPSSAETIFNNINNNFGDSRYVGKHYCYSMTSPVLAGGGSRYLQTSGGVLSSAVGKRLLRTGTITGASIQVDTADSIREYRLSIKINEVEVATLDLPLGGLGAHTTSLSVSYSAGSLLSVSIDRISGLGVSSFSNADVIIEIEEG